MMPFKGRSNPTQTIRVRGRKIARWTQKGGSKVSSVQSAMPTTIRPAKRVTKTAGPSPEFGEPEVESARRASGRDLQKALEDPALAAAGTTASHSRHKGGAARAVSGLHLDTPGRVEPVPHEAGRYAHRARRAASGAAFAITARRPR